MKTQGIDHVSIVVRDMDRAVETLSNVFGLAFKEIPEVKERMGIRICVSVPERQIELLSVVDPVKASENSDHSREIAEFAKRVGEGIRRLFLKVENVEKAAAEAQEKGLCVAHKLEENGLGEFIPHFREVLFSPEKGTPTYGIGLIEYVE
jgi:catechol 2,3-dioxygenase-like lactoylglutathione lyase family enzyme